MGRYKVYYLMTQLITIGLLAISFHISQVWSNSSVELQVRLNKIKSFNANFTQKVTNINGDLIQKSEGYLWIKWPNFFNWHTVLPDESWLVSDGSNLWFYNPLIEQVIITLLSEVMNDTPLILIIRNNPQDWNRYKITQQGNDFLLIEVDNNGNLKHLSITINPDGAIKQFSAAEKNGHINSFEFTNQKNNHFDRNKFQFIPPKGVTVDDQRAIKVK